MIDIQKIAEQAGLYVGTNISGVKLVGAGKEGGLLTHLTLEELEKFAALYREAVAQELVNEAGEPWCASYDTVENRGGAFLYYTADQLAGAVLRERERIAKRVEEYARANSENDNVVALLTHLEAAIRSGE